MVARFDFLIGSWPDVGRGVRVVTDSGADPVEVARRVSFEHGVKVYAWRDHRPGGEVIAAGAVIEVER